MSRTPTDAPMTDPKALDGIAAAFWLDLCEKDDRTSPEEYPDMCLIAQEELAAMLGYTFHLRDAEITHLTAQLAEAEAENLRLRGVLTNLANRVNIEGSPYHTAILSLDAIVQDVKRQARQALATERKS